MCGFAGCFDMERQTSTEMLQQCIQRMTRTLVHRGPDDEGYLVDATAGVALGFRRLAILDLSRHGHQPMQSPDERYALVFNGEIYNFSPLRSQLEAAAGPAVQFRGRSDTEVLLHAIARWGLQAALRRATGMFAFALWDRHEQKLHLARDRVGEKPLYYGLVGSCLLFGSELKALRACPDFAAPLDRLALSQYLRYGYVPGPASIYHGIAKLPPGTTVTVDLARQHVGSPRPYWSAADVARAGSTNPLTISDAEATEQLDVLLRDAVRRQMVADVPLGAFLSGGIDSSTIVALMQAQSSRPVRTFTIGFAEEKYNEATHAARVARHLGTDHTEMMVTGAETLEVLPRLPGMFDEPFADASQIPTFLVAQLARRHVTVSLSGDGGDELFAGYGWYRRTELIWNRFGWVPALARRFMGTALKGLSAAGWDRLFHRLGAVLPRRTLSGDRVHKLATLCSQAQRPEEVYVALVCRWNEGLPILDSEAQPTTLEGRAGALPDQADLLSRLMYLDQVTYLPDDILAKVDRTTMAVSLESRAPLLDHHVVEFAWRLPRRLRMRDGQGKWLLRQVLHRYVPAAIVDRPKMGFCAPTDHWLRGPLRDWAEELLSPQRLKREGYLDAATIGTHWREHLSGERNWPDHLWHVLMFQAWLAQQ
jgi:asparagine synthase (glutamine-hydrolysing)